jgi:dephospho-CoA kinase
VHPAVLARRAGQEAEARRRGAQIVVHDIPLLFEAADPATFDQVVLVDAPEAVRRDRLVRLRGLAPPEADALMAAQWPSSRKRAASHHVIDNDGDQEALRARAAAVWEALRKAAGAA